MRIVRHSEPDFLQALALLVRRASPELQVEQTVREIVDGLHQEVEKAMAEEFKR